MVKPSERVTSDIVGYINTHKTQIKEQLLREQQINTKLTQLNQLTSQQQNWFYSVAESLNYPAIALLQQEAIVIEDIIELSDRNPQVIAQCLIAGGLLDRLLPVDKCWHLKNGESLKTLKQKQNWCWKMLNLKLTIHNKKWVLQNLTKPDIKTWENLKPKIN